MGSIQIGLDEDWRRDCKSLRSAFGLSYIGALVDCARQTQVDAHADQCFIFARRIVGSSQGLSCSLSPISDRVFWKRLGGMLEAIGGLRWLVNARACILGQSRETVVARKLYHLLLRREPRRRWTFER